jgi:hypothetical protein
MATPDHPFYMPGVVIPRFLFRGFTKYSGGGLPGLNNNEGVIPRGFLLGCDKNIELDSRTNPKLVKARAWMHVTNNKSSPTPFSSWSHDWRTALAFSRTRPTSGNGPNKRQHLEKGEEGYIAVLDTWALGDERTRRNRIFHVPQFRRSYIPCEWLIWGPVRGPAYRCVPISAIRDAIGCQDWPRHGIPVKITPYLLLATDVHKSMVLGGCFRRTDDTSADVMLAVAAADLAARYHGKETRPFGPGHWATALGPEPLWPRHILKEVLDVIAQFKPPLSGRPLVHGNTAVEEFPRVSLMYDLLSGMETRWRENQWGTTRRHIFGGRRRVMEKTIGRIQDRGGKFLEKSGRRATRLAESFQRHLHVASASCRRGALEEKGTGEKRGT